MQKAFNPDIVRLPKDISVNTAVAIATYYLTKEKVISGLILKASADKEKMYFPLLFRVISYGCFISHLPHPLLCILFYMYVLIGQL